MATLHVRAVSRRACAELAAGARVLDLFHGDGDDGGGRGDRDGDFGESRGILARSYVRAVFYDAALAASFGGDSQSGRNHEHVRGTGVQWNFTHFRGIGIVRKIGRAERPSRSNLSLECLPLRTCCEATR